MEEHVGKIVRVNPRGLCIVLEEGLPGGKAFPFTFDKIDGYRGENPEELKKFSLKGLVEGVIVKFKLDKDHRVTLVRPLLWPVYSDEIPGLCR